MNLKNKVFILTGIILISFGFKQNLSISPKIPVNIPAGKIDTVGGDKVIVSSEVTPEYPGGIQALMMDLAINTKYPSEARRLNIQGKVFINFIIEKDGSISNIKVIRGGDLGGGLPEAAIKSVSMLKTFKPATQNNVPVRSSYNVPISFSLAGK